MNGQTQPRLYQLSLAIVTIACFGALAAIAYLGYYTRYHADDYCLALDTFNRNPFQFIDWGFRTIAGRFSFLFVFWLAAKAGMPMAQWLPAILLLLWLLVTYWAASAWVRWLHLPCPRAVALMLSALAVFCTLAAMPDLAESFYWMTGSLVYTLPLILFTLFLGLLTRVLPHSSGRIIPASLAGFVICLVAGALSDMFAGVQPVAVGLMWLVAAWFSWRSRSPIARRALIVLSASLFGALLSFVIVLIAPATASRWGYFPQTLTYGRIILRSLNWSVKLPIDAVRNYGLVYLSAALLPALVILLARHQQAPSTDSQEPRDRNVILQVGVAIIVFTYLMTLACNGLSVYSTTTGPISRTVAIPVFFWVLGCMGVGGVIGLLLPLQRVPMLAAFGLSLLLCVSPLLNIRSATAQIQPAQTRASLFDTRDVFLRASRAKNSPVEYVALNKYSRRFGDTFPNDDFAELWVRDCVARFYGFFNLYLK